MNISERTLAKLTYPLIKDWDAYQFFCRKQLKKPELTPNIKDQFPSLCHSCNKSRKTWSKDLSKSGYMGCTLLYNLEKSLSMLNNKKINIPDNIYESYEQDLFNAINCAETLATGWVILSSGMATNHQLITRMVSKCPFYEHII